MNKQILVTYATRAGSTAGVAQAVANRLMESGVPVDLRRMEEVTDLTPYQAVVAGSAIHGGKWLPEAMRFLKTHRAALSQRPFAAFSVCITLSMAGAEQYRDGISAWMQPVRDLVRPVSEGMFAGALDFRKLPLSFNALLMRLPVLFRVWKTGDHRDWAAIRAWTDRTRPMLYR